jgi:hypothetical protein
LTRTSILPKRSIVCATSDLTEGFVAHVEYRARNRIAAVGAGDRIRNLGAIGNVGDHQSRALGGERQRIMPAETLGTAGDNRDPPIQPPHDFKSPWSSFSELFAR